MPNPGRIGDLKVLDSERGIPRLPRIMHIGMGIVCGSKIKDVVKAGFDFIIFLADWHSWINNKLGGDMERIRLCGEYFKHCFTSLGIKPESVRYLWASDITNDVKYWEKVVRVAKSVSLQRTRRALPIMGRDMSLTDMETAWVYYPCMQAADIFHLKLDLACAGIDQRKAHMLARDAAEKIGWNKPVCVHTHLLSGLHGPGKDEKKFDEKANINLQIRSKMSKSKPTTSIYIHDTPKDIKRKIRRAYCPPRQVRGNSILEIAKHIIFSEKESLKIPRLPENGGPKSFKNYVELERAYVKARIHPLDLKEGVAGALIEILEPVREYFQRQPHTLKRMMDATITR